MPRASFVPLEPSGVALLADHRKEGREKGNKRRAESKEETDRVFDTFKVCGSEEESINRFLYPVVLLLVSLTFFSSFVATFLSIGCAKDLATHATLFPCFIPAATDQEEERRDVFTCYHFLNTKISRSSLIS